MASISRCARLSVTGFKPLSGLACADGLRDHLSTIAILINKPFDTKSQSAEPLRHELHTPAANVEASISGDFLRRVSLLDTVLYIR